MAAAYRHTEKVLRDNLDKLQAVSPRRPRALRTPVPPGAGPAITALLARPLTPPVRRTPENDITSEAPPSSTERSAFRTSFSFVSLNLSGQFPQRRRGDIANPPGPVTQFQPAVGSGPRCLVPFQLFTSPGTSKLNCKA